jgi:hypothetical protein
MNYLVNPDISVEISVNAIAPMHEAQLLSYLRLYETCTRGLLINFNVKRLVEGIRRMKIYPPLCVFCGLCGSFNCLSYGSANSARGGIQAKIDTLLLSIYQYSSDRIRYLESWDLEA